VDLPGLRDALSRLLQREVGVEEPAPRCAVDAKKIMLPLMSPAELDALSRLLQREVGVEEPAGAPLVEAIHATSERLERLEKASLRHDVDADG
jgi:hypothetical protein